MNYLFNWGLGNTHPKNGNYFALLASFTDVKVSKIMTLAFFHRFFI